MAALKLLLLLGWIAGCYACAWPLKKLGKISARDRVVVRCYQGILRIVGIRLKVTGAIGDVRPLLLVTNHLSYLDVVLLGGVPGLRFTPKSEVAAWPGIGAICRLCDAVFIDRRPGKVKLAGAGLRAALEKGELVCVFPEATTGNGVRMLPFRSGFFSLAEEMPLTVQPAAIIYTRIGRLPISLGQWPKIAWYGDMALAPHLWELLKLGRIDAELAFLPPVTIAGHGDRKRLAAHCAAAIAEAIDWAKIQ